MGVRARGLLPCVLVVAALAVLGSTLARSFVSPAARSRNAKTLRALPQPGQQTEEKTQEEDGGFDFKMPKPDMRLMNQQSKAGLSVDQDRRGNMWSLEPETRFQEESEDLLPAPIYFPIIIALTIGSIFFFAKLTNDDPRFGGSFGDDARLINEWG